MTQSCLVRAKKKTQSWNREKRQKSYNKPKERQIEHSVTAIKFLPLFPLRDTSVLPCPLKLRWFWLGSANRTDGRDAVHAPSLAPADLAHCYSYRPGTLSPCEKAQASPWEPHGEGPLSQPGPQTCNKSKLDHPEKTKLTQTRKTTYSSQNKRNNKLLGFKPLSFEVIC